MHKNDKLTSPIVLLKNSIVFPGSQYTFVASDAHDKKAVSLAASSGGILLLVPALYEDGSETPQKVLGTACAASIENISNGENSSVVVTVRLLQRMKIESTGMSAGVNTATAVAIETNENSLSHEEESAARKKLIKSAQDNVEIFKVRFPNVTFSAVPEDVELDILCDYISANVLISLDAKEDSFTTFDIRERVIAVAAGLASETELLSLERDLLEKVRESLGDSQKNAFLREQMRIIKQELGEDEPDEVEEFYNKIEESLFSEEIKEKLYKEVRRMASFHFGSPDYAVIKGYLDTCLELPCEKIRRESYDIDAAKKILDDDHDGLNDIKERILEFLSVANLKPDAPLQVLCLVGPPGTGKTSVAKSIARAMNRPYARVSLGGVRDESDIRGHRKTYVGAMPGRIINAFLQAKATNPVILLDEIDKMGQSHNGDPAAALLEVLDMEQNVNFRDHYIEFPYDISEALFITTANTLSTVPRPLLDRMEVIELHSYSRAEKLSIAKHHLVPKQLDKHGVKRSQMKFTDGALLKIIDEYTKEAGVRNLERKIASAVRKGAVSIVKGETEDKISVKVSNVEDFLGPKIIFGEKSEKKDLVGVTNGLAYTEAGGDMLKIEVCVLPGSGKIELTGSLGDVMKESAKIAVSAIRARSEELGIDSEFYKNSDIHIHVPEGAVPKDGPSAGVTLFTSILSALSKRPVRGDIAMTGEITLTGRVLPIGGLKEKSMAAMAAGIDTLLIPKDNFPETLKFDDSIKSAVKYTSCTTVDDVIRIALR
ncbi:MAG: endopeptidase La [Ruminococcaceae bacterium]|nr:endopeptidase La [Oscillospiraceae bacterium]